MARRFDVNKEQSLAQISAGNAGNGNDKHCPNGKSSYDGSITFRTLLRFAHDWSGMTKVTRVLLYMHKTSGVHTAQGGSARAAVNRCGDSGSWSSGGGAENSWSTSASGERYPGPSSGTTSYGSMTGSGWQSVDILDSYRAMVPTYIDTAIGAGLGETNNGIRVRADTESSTSESFEFDGAASSYPPYLMVYYESNTAPNQPVGTSPADGASLAPGTVPSFSWTGSDPDSGDTRSASALQVSLSSTFSSYLYDGVITGADASFSQTARPYPGPTLPSGVPLYWRVRNTDADGANSSYSATKSFTIAAVPTVSGQAPGSGALADIHNLGDTAAIWTLGGAHAKPIVKWTYNHPGGTSMAAYRVRMYSDALAVLWDSGTVVFAAAVGAVVTVNVPTAIILGTQYRWGVEVQDTAGNWSAAMTPTTFKVRWGQAIYSQNVGVGASGLAFTNGAVANGRAAFAYRAANDAAGASPTAWVTDVGLLPEPMTQAYVQIVARLVAVTAGSNPTLADMSLTYASAVQTPDKWLVAGAGTITLDKNIRRYGRYSVKLRASSTTAPYLYPFRQTASDGIVVQQDTDYTISGYVNTGGVALPAGCYLQIIIFTTAGATLAPSPWYPQDVGTARITNDTRGYPEGWQRLQGSFRVPSGVTAIRPAFWLGSTPVAGTTVWIDAVKLEPGRVASPWTPGFMSEAGTLDSQGFLVDASLGGIFRLRGSANPITTPRATIELYQKGLRYAQDTELSSPSTGVMAVNDVPISLNTHSHAAPGLGTMQGASTRVAGTSQNPAVNTLTEYRHGAPGAGEDPNGFYQSGTGRLIVPAGMGGLYLYDVWMTGTAPTGTTSGQLAYAVAHLNLVTAGVIETLCRWDRFDSGAEQGAHGQALRMLAAGETLFMNAHARIAAGTTMRVSGWSLVRLATGVA